jgi:hypothetical protein
MLHLWADCDSTYHKMTYLRVEHVSKETLAGLYTQLQTKCLQCSELLFLHHDHRARPFEKSKSGSESDVERNAEEPLLLSSPDGPRMETFDASPSSYATSPPRRALKSSAYASPRSNYYEPLRFAWHKSNHHSSDIRVGTSTDRRAKHPCAVFSSLPVTYYPVIIIIIILCTFSYICLQGKDGISSDMKMVQGKDGNENDDVAAHMASVSPAVDNIQIVEEYRSLLNQCSKYFEVPYSRTEYLSLYHSMTLSIYLSIYRSIDRSIYIFIYLPQKDLFIYVSIYLYMHVSIYLCIVSR